MGCHLVPLARQLGDAQADDDNGVALCAWS